MTQFNWLKDRFSEIMEESIVNNLPSDIDERVEIGDCCTIDITIDLESALDSAHFDYIGASNDLVEVLTDDIVDDPEPYLQLIFDGAALDGFVVVTNKANADEYAVYATVDGFETIRVTKWSEYKIASDACEHLQTVFSQYVPIYK